MRTRSSTRIVGGWSINGIYTYQSGEPFTIRSGVLTANFSAQSRAALKPGVELPQPKLQEKAGVVGPVFFPNADAFTFPGPGQLGIGRNIFQGPSYWNVDVGITKGFRITEKARAGVPHGDLQRLQPPEFPQSARCRSAAPRSTRASSARPAA